MAGWSLLDRLRRRRLGDDFLIFCQGVLSRTALGTSVLRAFGRVLSRVAPYTPPRADLAPELARAFVSAEIRPSGIPGAGLGLFALEDVEAGTTIGEYVGDVVDSVFRRLRTRDPSYLCRTLVRGVYIDAARRPEAQMRYLCHHPKKDRRNVRFRLTEEGVFCVATRSVRAGEEFFIDYGDSYWSHAGVEPGADSPLPGTPDR